MLEIKENGIKLNGVFWGRKEFPEVEVSSLYRKTDLSNMEYYSMKYIAMEFIVETTKKYYGDDSINRDIVEKDSCFQDGRLYLNDFNGYFVDGFLISSLILLEEGRFILEGYKIDEETGEETDEEIYFLLS